jgi:hypothetical protein
MEIRTGYNYNIILIAKWDLWSISNIKYKTLEYHNNIYLNIIIKYVQKSGIEGHYLVEAIDPIVSIMLLLLG